MRNAVQVFYSERGGGDLLSAVQYFFVDGKYEHG